MMGAGSNIQELMEPCIILISLGAWMFESSPIQPEIIWLVGQGPRVPFPIQGSPGS